MSASLGGLSVCHLTSVHQPRDVRILDKECESLAANGATVTLVVPCEKDVAAAGGRTKVVCVRPPRSRLHRMAVTAWEVGKTACSVNAAVYHLHDPELIPVGWALKLRGHVVVYDAHENLPKQVLGKSWIPRWLRRPVAWISRAIEWAACRTFDAVVAATPSIHQRLRDAILVQNFPRPMTVTHPRTRYEERPRRVLYHGGITSIRGAVEMVDAIGLVARSYHARLALAGEIQPAALRDKLEKHPAWRRVDYRGWVSRREVREMLSSAGVGLVLYHPLPNHIDSQPNKLFEYMAAGIPVIAADYPRWREIVDGSGCGLLVDPLDPSAISSAIKWVFDHPQEAKEMGLNGRNAVHSRYNWEVEERKLVTLYERLAQ